MTRNIDRERYAMRAPCECGSELGYLKESNGQDIVRCVSCDRYQYCAPRTETGRAQRTGATVHAGIKPSQRSRILSRGNHACERCHAHGVVLHVGHIISVDSGLRFGMSDAELNDDENLMCLCETCNLGMGPEPMPLRNAIAVLRARLAWARENPGK